MSLFATIAISLTLAATGIDFFKYLEGSNKDASHPHGDLDRIDLTNNYPIVSQGKLYGEPIARLQEGILARHTCFLWLFGPDGSVVRGIPTHFTKSLSGNIEFVVTNFYKMNYYPFVDKNHLKGGDNVYGVSEPEDIFEKHPEYFAGYTYTNRIDDIKSGDILYASKFNNANSVMTNLYNRGFMWTYYDSYLTENTGTVAGPTYYNNYKPDWEYDQIYFATNYYNQGYLRYNQFHGSYYSGYTSGWRYRGCDFSANGGYFTIGITSEHKDILKQVDFVTPVFVVNYDETGSYRENEEDKPTCVSTNYYTMCVGSNTYRFDSNGVIRIPLTDAVNSFSPEYNRTIITSPRGTSINHSHTERVYSIYLIATLKEGV